MFKNYIKVALRNIVRHKGYSFINIIGLAVGMACCIMILLWVQNELNFDRFHTRGKNIYRLYNDMTVGGITRQTPMSSAPMAAVLTEEFPEIEEAVRISPENRRAVQYKDKQYYENQVRYADNSFFDIFSFRLIKGDPKSVLTTAYTAVLTQDAAAKYFGDEDPIGKTLILDYEKDYTVVGVVENIPANSHIDFKMLISFETLVAEKHPSVHHWRWFGYHTYILLNDNAVPENVDQKLVGFVERHMSEGLSGTLAIHLQPLYDIHLHSNLQGDSNSGSIFYVYLFSGIALFILILACINFVNLSTARSAARAEEVGMRKTFGAGRRKIIGQFLGESILISFLSIFIVAILLEIGLPVFNRITNSALDINYTESFWIIPALIGFALLVGILAGSYPAFYLSSFRPIKVLKGDLALGAANSKFRGLLVVVQSTISVALVIGTLAIFWQTNYLKTKEPGFNKENVIVLPDISVLDQISREAAKAEVSSIPGVLGVTTSTAVPSAGGMRATFVPEGFSDDDKQFMRVFDMDGDFINTMKMEIISGRNFSDDLATDRKGSAIINEAAARAYGWDNPIGKIIKRRYDYTTQEWFPTTVIGVVKDFHLSSLHTEIEPLFIGNVLDFQNILSARVDPNKTTDVLAKIERWWNGISPQIPFDYYFLSDSYEGLYGAEEQLGDITLYFCLLAIFLGSLGIIGLSSFTAEQRIKEVGIRKVLGASISSILGLFVREFILLIGIANLLAWPIAYYAIDNWLKDFPYHINIGWELFAIAATVAFSLTLLTVSYHAMKIARTNPAECLKYE